jgi:enoyl-CoA hydratase/carnithine racemase
MPLVTCEIADGIAQVRLNRPDKLNALTLDLLDELVDVARRLRRDPSLRAVVLAGSGDAFCAGLDFADTLSRPRKMWATFTPRPWRGTNVFQEAPWAWRRIPVPVIAAVSGHCLGGGVQIALAADFRFADPDSTWSVLEGKWGLIPDMSGIQALKELVGIDVAKRLTMTAAMMSGKQAHEIGLVTELSADPVASATAFARELSERSPDALAAAKRLFDRSWTSGPRRTFARERAEQLRLLLGANFKIAQKAAFKRQSPEYQPRGTSSLFSKK